MDTQEIEFRDPVVKRVVNKFVDRSNIGFEKYGRTLDAERTGGHKDLYGYLNDVQEELMDAILYIQAAKEEFSDNKEQAELDIELERMNRINIIAQNGNTGEHYEEAI